MPTFKTKGIIIKKNNLQEADRILTIFTDNLGKIKAYARGVRKSTSKLSGHLDLFTCCNLILAKGKNIPTIVSAQEERVFLNLKNDLKKTSVAFQAAELVDKFTFEEHKDTRIFRLLDDLFAILDESNIEFNSEKPAVLLQAFQIKLLNLLGFSPELTRCIHCKKELAYETNYFSSLLGGVLCRDCRSFDLLGIKLEALILKILRLLKREDFDFIKKLKIQKEEIFETEKILNHFLYFLLEKNLKSPNFVKQVKRLA